MGVGPIREITGNPLIPSSSLAIVYFFPVLSDSLMFSKTLVISVPALFSYLSLSSCVLSRQEVEGNEQMIASAPKGSSLVQLELLISAPKGSSLLQV